MQPAPVPSALVVLALCLAGCARPDRLYPEPHEVAGVAVPHSGVVLAGPRVTRHPLDQEWLLSKATPFPWLTGQVGERTIPVLVDTGIPEIATATLDAARALGLELRPLPPGVAEDGREFVASSVIPELRLGERVLREVPVLVHASHWHLEVAGVNVWDHAHLTLGAGALTRFHWIAIAGGELTLSEEPPDPRGWRRFPLSFAQDGRPLVHLPVQGAAEWLLADTGGGVTLALGSERWPERARSFRVVDDAELEIDSWDGFWTTREIEVAELRLAGRQLANRRIRLFPGAVGVVGPPVLGDVIYDFAGRALLLRE